MSTQTLNSLSRASSSYLRSAMHQPIRWYEWGEEAFATAQRENKPMLLDIGAVWCHWCHVMDRESYENPDIAEIINERFIAVKVDRDERPDIDSRYQAAVSAVSGQGGWPLTAFLTPDGKPFYGGTYFPPEDHYGRPSFKRVLLSISAAYHEKNADVLEQAKMVETAISQAESFAKTGAPPSTKVIQEIIDSCRKMFDSAHGGFGSAPKFPHPAALELIIDQYVRTGDEELRDIFTSTLEKMAQGGVYDHLAGGFHRYSVDERWVVPHFEKMIYDNSELLKNYIHAYQSTGSDFFANVARDIIRWMDEWLTDRDHGGFYASQDADYSMDDDGDYFTWTLDEARAVLTEEELSVASLYHDINEVGEMHHNPAKNVLYVRSPLGDIAKRLNLPLERLQQLLDSAKKKMYAARLTRPTPYVDKTVYVGWNALAVSAYLEAAKILDLVDARHFALRSLDRILSRAWRPETGLRHVIAYGDAQAASKDISGVLEDYAFTASACLDAYESTSDLSYFHFARGIADCMVQFFFDRTAGGFFDTEQRADQPTLGVLGTRRKPFQDSPTPAGNSVAACVMSRLYSYTHQETYRNCAEQTLEILAGTAGKYGLFAATYGLAAIQFALPHIEVVIVGEDEGATRLYQAATSKYAVNKTVIRMSFNEAVAENLPPSLAQSIPNLPALRDRKSVGVVCAGFSCQAPASDPKLLTEQINRALSNNDKK